MTKKKLEVQHSKGVSTLMFDSLGNKQEWLDHDFVLIDENVVMHAVGLPPRVMSIATSEDRKNMETVVEIVDWLALNGANKHSCLYAVGGGVIQDLATMASSLFMRGIRWKFFPTTTNTMLDACVGGKSAINSLHAKNLLGNFYPPETVILDPSVLVTLSPLHYFGGIFEAIKIVFAENSSKLDSFLSDLEQKNYQVDEEIVETSLAAKIRIVEDDEFDAGRRLLLNYGHTFGHALEAASRFSVPHGVSIGLGMLAANSLGSRSHPSLLVLEKAILRLLGMIDPPIQRQAISVDWKIFVDALLSDKKQTLDSILFVVPNEKGSLQLLPIAKNDLDIAVRAMKEQLIL